MKIDNNECWTVEDYLKEKDITLPMLSYKLLEGSLFCGVFISEVVGETKSLLRPANLLEGVEDRIIIGRGRPRSYSGLVFLHKIDASNLVTNINYPVSAFICSNKLHYHVGHNNDDLIEYFVVNSKNEIPYRRYLNEALEGDYEKQEFICKLIGSNFKTEFDLIKSLTEKEDLKQAELIEEYNELIEKFKFREARKLYEIEEKQKKINNISNLFIAKLYDFMKKENTGLLTRDFLEIGHIYKPESTLTEYFEGKDLYIGSKYKLYLNEEGEVTHSKSSDRNRIWRKIPLEKFKLDELLIFENISGLYIPIENNFIESLEKDEQYEDDITQANASDSYIDIVKAVEDEFWNNLDDGECAASKAEIIEWIGKHYKLYGNSASTIERTAQGARKRTTGRPKK